MPSAPLSLALAISLVLLNAFFVAAEFSLVRVRSTRITELAAEGDWRARAAEAALRRLDAFLSATQLGITCTSLGLGWVGEPAFAGVMAPLFTSMGVTSETLIHNASVAVAFLVITFLHIVVGELAPKSYAIRATERVALWTALPMRLFQIACGPALWLLARASSGTLRMLGVADDNHEGPAHSEEELRLVVEESHRQGTLSGEKRELLENIIDYTERTARHVMIPRADVAFLSLGRELDENLAVITQTAHTRFPLASSDIDHVIGMVHVKDLFMHRQSLATSKDLIQIKREILFVPESRPLDALQREFQQSRTHMAIVVDEYGGASGILTLEDILEEIVGEIQDEFDREPPKFAETADGLVFDGLTLVDDVCERLGVKVDVPGEVSTIGGFLGDQLGRIPRPGDRIPVGEFDLCVMEMSGRRVTRVLAARRLTPATEAS